MSVKKYCNYKAAKPFLGKFFDDDVFDSLAATFK